MTAAIFVIVKDEGELVNPTPKPYSPPPPRPLTLKKKKRIKSVFNQSFVVMILLLYFFQVSPYIVSSPPSKIQVRNVGNYVKLHCSGGGLPLPDVKWFKDGRPVLSTTMHNGTDLINSEIVIRRFRPSDAGIYKCRFYNDENGTAEASTTISIALFC